MQAMGDDEREEAGEIGARRWYVPGGGNVCEVGPPMNRNTKPSAAAAMSPRLTPALLPALMASVPSDSASTLARTSMVCAMPWPALSSCAAMGWPAALTGLSSTAYEAKMAAKISPSLSM